MANNDSAAEHDHETSLRRWWAIAGLALFGATWRLWTPQTEFPQVPLFDWAGSIPLIADWFAFGVLLVSFAMTAWQPDSRRSWSAIVVALGALFVLDQHRLQPWAWQMGLLAVGWSCRPVGQVFNLPERVRSRQVENLPYAMLTISIYFWSAVSKFEPSFYTSHGQTLVEALFQSVGLHAANWPARVKWWLAFSLPVGELLVAAGLCFPRARKAALIAATALHVGLILALGPTGLGHRPSVLLWNVAFIGHDWLLFGRRTNGHSKLTQSVKEGENSRQSFAASLTLRIRLLVIVLACVWPMTARWGLCDYWLAWSVYSTQIERVGVTLTDNGVRRLPDSARQLAADGELWLDRWSLAALDVPIYPQLRFQLGVVEELRRRCGDENLIEISVQRSQHDGGSVERLTIAECDEQRAAFWINSRPRGGSLAGNRP